MIRKLEILAGHSLSVFAYGFKKVAQGICFVTLSACALSAGTFNGDGPINVDANGVAIKGYDVISYYEKGKPMQGSKKFQVRYAGAKFFFASAKNRDRFAKKPREFVPAFGGFCALGVANGYKDDMDPAAFEVVGNRLYFNLTPRIQIYWSRSKEHFIQRAEANWSRLKNAPGHGPSDGY